MVALLAAQALALAAEQGSGPLLSGQVANWDHDEAQLAAMSFTEDAPLGTIAEGTIAADGAFELGLPAEVPAELLTRLDATEICPEAPEGLSLTPESFMGAGVFALGVLEDEAMTGFIAQASSEAVALETEGAAQVGDFAVFYAYATESVTIRGTCVREGETEAINIDLQQGWNTLISTSTEVTDGASSAMETTVGEVPTGAGWYYMAMPEMPEGEGGASEVVWAASTEGEGIPEEVAPGYTVFTLDNDGEAPYTLTLFRLKEGATFEAFQAANARIEEAFAEGGDVVTAINEGLELVDVAGEFDAEAGESSSFGVVLEEGDYALEGSPQSEGVAERFYQTFTVTGEAQAEAPEADVTVQMVDFAFAFPPNLTAGEQLWHVVNSGQQLHHIVLFKLGEGMTVDDLMAWMETEEGEPPGEPAGYVGIMSAGESNYHTLELSAGEYVAICFMPDHLGEATGMPHFMLGMMQSFTVAGN
ncbi:hypothetical protein BH24DEI1_BH24DEI1_17900 [soil metagenome]